MEVAAVPGLGEGGGFSFRQSPLRHGHGERNSTLPWCADLDVRVVAGSPTGQGGGSIGAVMAPPADRGDALRWIPPTCR